MSSRSPFWTPAGTVTFVLVVRVAPTDVIDPGAGVAVEVAVAVAVAVAAEVEVAVGAGPADAFSASAILAHPPLFIEPTSAGINPAAPRVLLPAATPKCAPATYWLITNPFKSPGKTRLVFSVAKKPTYRSLLRAVANEQRLGDVLFP